MQLTYRGLTYNYRPPQVEETQSLGLAGSYRGLDYRFRRTGTENVMQPSVDLTYRGVAFNPAQPVTLADKAHRAAIAPTVEAVPQVSFQERVRARFYQKAQAVKKRQQSLLLRLAAEVSPA